jgi:lipoprotein-anchoring transpeptidase ErfK/SrfK
MQLLARASTVLILAAITLSAAHRPAKKAPPAVDQQALRLQVLLDRAHFSPGQIDASVGNVTHLMLAAFQTQHGLPATGAPDDATTQALEQGQESIPTTISYTIIYDDVRGPFTPLPSDMMAEAKLPALNYQSAWEGVGEKFHCSPALLHRLNPQQVGLKPGDQITVPNIHHDIPQGAASIAVSKAARTVQVLDASGKPIATYPATIGSQHDPLPIGDWKVTKVEWNPTFYYDPNLFWNAKPQDAKATIKPGPRNPVGVVWIGLDKEHYGLHGTPVPASIGHTESHGCVRLTNWDAAEIAQMVSGGMPVVFKE